MDINALKSVVVAALLVEAIVTNIKPIYDKEKGWNIDIIASIILGIVVCVLAGIDLFALIGIPFIVPYVGAALTGLLISRGANVIHDILSSLGSWAAAMRSRSK